MSSLAQEAMPAHGDAADAHAIFDALACRNLHLNATALALCISRSTLH
ncbi:hypothetical protein [Bordetella holmesii]|nr:hypothetical protein [Bordetella holmesii]AMD50546.1 hypothetical protein F783_007005 [Bordetella holmesii F627]MBO1243852.1 hypothetical protein [Bordetella holmesii]MBO1246993.1 hypothetical protein [Bordetella holmesii]MBO1252929.1 hypothetical protein [Bordetella holmesii]MBO1262339.1 hypothetical protein [Bordetella holmesii]